MPACAPGPGRTPRSCCWADACAARSSKSVLHSRRGMCTSLVPSSFNFMFLPVHLSAGADPLFV